MLDPVMTFNNLSVEAMVRAIPASGRWFPKAWRDTVDTRLRSTSTFTTAYPRAAAKYRELFGN